MLFRHEAAGGVIVVHASSSIYVERLSAWFKNPEINCVNGYTRLRISFIPLVGACLDDGYVRLEQPLYSALAADPAALRLLLTEAFGVLGWNANTACLA
jgi:hypothetical protein